MNNRNIEVLDCTLRDGGYYTNWDFAADLVDEYLRQLGELPVDIIEVGYRSKPLEGYFGEYFYSPTDILKSIRERYSGKIAIMLNEKEVRPKDIEDLLLPCQGSVDLVRIALNPDNFNRGIKLAEAIKQNGYQVAVNIMYMSSWQERGDFLAQLSSLDGLADYLNLVDSYGGVFPDDVKQIVALVKTKTNCKLGYHGHNNLELGLINALTAIEEGAVIVDATITGMGRGAGNLKTELLLTALNMRYGWDINFDALSNVVNLFNDLHKEHGWGTNLPYMVSGANSLPQKDVMEWITKRFYSFNSIVRTLENRKQGEPDNIKFPLFEPSKSYRSVLIIGGGSNGVIHSKAIIQFLCAEEDICIIHASSKNAVTYSNLSLDQYYCLVGNEGHRLEKVSSGLNDFKGKCVLPPYPRKMGTYVPQNVLRSCYELDEIKFTPILHDSHTVLALQTAISLKCNSIFLAGYDGYKDHTITRIERALSSENEYSFARFQEHTNNPLISLTPTEYQQLEPRSVYSYIY